MKAVGVRLPSIGSSIGIACIAAALALAGSARAADQVPDWAAWGIRNARKDFPQKSRVPEGYDRSELEKLLFPDGVVVSEEGVEVPWLLFVKPWKASPGLSVAVLETVTLVKAQFGQGAAAGATALHIAVFAGGTAGAKADIKAEGWLESVAERHLQDIDLAPYRLAPDKLAFGVRTRMSWPLVGGGAENEYLVLLLPDGQEIKKVWATLMMSWRMSNDGYFEEGSSIKAEGGEQRIATIGVLKTATRGLCDLRKSGWKKHPAVYRWNGTSYVTKDKDPVPNVNGWPEAVVE
jgi:hypothetical protein